MPLRQLIYSSRWTEAATRDLDLTLQQIITTSIQNNRMCDVTAFLIARDGVFLQMLEGPSREVSDTFRRIGTDPRHASVRVISDSQTAKRLFQHWNMAGAIDAAGRALDEASLDGDAARALLLEAAGDQSERERRLYV